MNASAPYFLGGRYMERISIQEPLASPKLRQLRDYWLEACGDRRMPSRRDIDPISIPHLLPNITLIDVVRDPLRFRYRLIGTAITELTGRDATGRWLDSKLYGENLDEMLWTFQTCTENREPVAVRQKAQFPDRDWLLVEVLLVPMGTSDEAVDVIMSGLVAVDEDVKQPSQDIGYILDWRLDAAS
ncbi:MAG: PAS domain-containing protein [Alphaproteobacteria bacterium]|jgi:hypothetical protein|nr:PAS domain-containing protein [Alphaproteobacteria bacterium]